jgi:SAM-dependent methyltransferase
VGERGEAAEDDLRFASPSPWTQGWESIWAGLDAMPEYWRTPERAVVTWAEHLWEAGGRRVLDLGCGIGRHAVALARLGFAVTTTDGSPSGLMACAAWLADFVVDDLRLVRVEYVGEGGVIRVSAHYHVEARRP